jgi:hypothetical protein
MAFCRAAKTARWRPPTVAIAALVLSLNACQNAAAGDTDRETGDAGAGDAAAPTEATPGAATPAPALASALGADERTALAAIRQDPRPAKLSRGLHFIVSDEKRHDRFREVLNGVGGVFIGVGTDQNYTMAGWAKPELLVLLDFDQVVVDLHGIYRLVFLQAKTPQEFRRWWSFPERTKLKALLREHTPEGPVRAGMLSTLALTRPTVAHNLDLLMQRYRNNGVPFFMNDESLFQVVRNLFLEDRVVAVRGDLTARRTLSDLATVLLAHRRVVRVLYLSNAEQYFRYAPAFRQNLLGLPYDAQSWILRTRPLGFDYAYLAQRPDKLKAWLEDPRTLGLGVMVPRKLLSRRTPFMVLDGLPPPPGTRLSRHKASSVPEE